MAEPNKEFMTRAEMRRARQQAEEERRRAEDAERQRRAQETLEKLGVNVPPAEGTAAPAADGHAVVDPAEADRFRVAETSDTVDEFDDLDESRPEDAEYAPEHEHGHDPAEAEAEAETETETETETDVDHDAAADPQAVPDDDEAEPDTAATPLITAVPRSEAAAAADPSHGTAGPGGPRPAAPSGATAHAAARRDDFDDVVGPQRNETHPVIPARQSTPPQVAASQATAAAPVARPLTTDSAPVAAPGPETDEQDDRQTFLRHEEDLGELPAQQGLRGFLNRLGFSLEPTGEELRDRARRARVGRRVGRPRTVSIVNGKGGANKTPTTVLLAAVFGRNSSQSVLAWDNNGTRGTLGWRTAKDAHEGHVMDLLHDADRLLGVSPTELSIDGYVHYQQTDRFSVLRTEPTLLAAEQSVSSRDFDTLHEVVSRYFQITFVDSGNDESAERWLRMIDHTDQLVIASTTVEEHAEAGALLLAALTKRGGRYAELARNAVVVVSQQSPNINPGQLRRIRRGFEDLARTVVTVPYDSHLVKGKIRYDALKPATQRAWLEAAAAVSDGLVDTASEPRPQ
ncbi:ATPase [Zhihengliuella sp.]|uniref:ATPase n=1 Tax=Zhihengliuella sp. TaxID=1954483 RepID=UPI002811A5E6|nr:ATPase [Zhihengliuella sp.]